jgi:sulfhydrogenase subunit beta (sulfur reductase)
MRFIDRAGFAGLLSELSARDYQLIGPTVRDGAIVLDRIEGDKDLPVGVGEEQAPGSYRLLEQSDHRYFGFAHGPDSAKRFLFPAREVMGTVARGASDLAVESEPLDETKFAFVGLRACDLSAILVQDKVFLWWDQGYRVRRENAFVIAVNCHEPGATCFCASIGTGPRCQEGFDLALTEMDDGFLVESATQLGGEVLAAVATREATVAEVAEGERRVAEAAERMGRDLDTTELRELLYRNRDHPRWEVVADRCLACGNCTAVCPTCFCHDVVDAVDLTGQQAARTREWASCFSEEFSHIVGGSVRTGRDARYRQWLTHKFASWIDQFGTSGCVGCGRCITWCPVGIDITEELAAIRATDGAVGVGA